MKHSAWLSVWCALGMGCSTMTIPDYPGPPADKVAHEQTAGGLSVSVYPMRDSDEVDDCFEADLASEDILPLFIKVKNSSRSKSFAVFNDQISLDGLSAPGAGDLLDRVASPDAGKTVATVGVVCILLCPILSIPLVPTGAKMGSNATVRRHNFVIKELQTTTLSPGDEAQGFVYFSLPEGGLTSDLCVARLKAKDLSSGAWQESACRFACE